jgi:hypothetical protein
MGTCLKTEKNGTGDVGARQICVRILDFFFFNSVLILLCICPRTTIHVSSYYCIQICVITLVNMQAGGRFGRIQRLLAEQP